MCKIKEAISDVEYMKESHICWAEYFEENPEIEKKYVSTGDWDNAHTHREYVKKYDNILEILNSIKEGDI